MEQIDRHKTWDGGCEPDWFSPTGWDRPIGYWYESDRHAVCNKSWLAPFQRAEASAVARQFGPEVGRNFLNPHLTSQPQNYLHSHRSDTYYDVPSDQPVFDWWGTKTTYASTARTSLLLSRKPPINPGHTDRTVLWWYDVDHHPSKGQWTRRAVVWLYRTADDTESRHITTGRIAKRHDPGMLGSTHPRYIPSGMCDALSAVHCGTPYWNPDHAPFTRDPEFAWQMSRTDLNLFAQPQLLDRLLADEPDTEAWQKLTEQDLKTDPNSKLHELYMRILNWKIQEVFDGL